MRRETGGWPSQPARSSAPAARPTWRMQMKSLMTLVLAAALAAPEAAAAQPPASIALSCDPGAAAAGVEAPNLHGHWDFLMVQQYANCRRCCRARTYRDRHRHRLERTVAIDQVDALLHDAEALAVAAQPVVLTAGEDALRLVAVFDHDHGRADSEFAFRCIGASTTTLPTGARCARAASAHGCEGAPAGRRASSSARGRRRTARPGRTG